MGKKKKKGQTHRKRRKVMTRGWAGDNGEAGKSVQTFSYKMKKVQGLNVKPGDFSG